MRPVRASRELQRTARTQIHLQSVRTLFANIFATSSTTVLVSTPTSTSHWLSTLCPELVIRARKASKQLPNLLSPIVDGDELILTRCLACASHIFTTGQDPNLPKSTQEPSYQPRKTTILGRKLALTRFCDQLPTF